MNRWLLFLLLLPVFSCHRQPVLPEDNHSRAESEHISNGQVNAFAQDSHGQIWMATSRGLNRYDGKTFHQFFHSADTLSLPNDHVSDILADAAGNLWVATWDGVARMDRAGYFHKVAFREGADNNAFKLAVMPSGDVFAVYQSHVAVCRSGASRFVNALEIPGAYGRAGLHPGAGNMLWVVTLDRIYCLDTVTLELEVVFDSPHPVLRSYEAGDGTLGLVGSRQCTLFNTRSRQFISSGMKETDWPELAGYEHLSFPVSQIRTVFSDSNGNLWLGSEDQGFQVLPSRQNAYGDIRFLREFFQRKSIASVAATPEGNLWVSTKGGDFFYCDVAAERITPVSLAPFLNDNQVGYNYCNRIMVARDGSLWLCMLGSLQVVHAQYRNHRLEPIHLYTGIQAPISLLEMPDGSVWTGNVAGSILRLQDGKTDTFELFATGQIHLVDGLFPIDSEHFLASSLFGGLCLLDLSGNINSLSDAPVTCLVKDKKGRVLVYIDQEGWFQFSDGALTALDYPLLQGGIASACEDEDGNLWLGTYSGLVRMDLTDGEYDTFTEEEGISGNEFTDFCVTRLPDGHLVFGGPKGLTLFIPVNDEPGRNVPLRFQELRIHNRLVSPGPGAPAAQLLDEAPAIRLGHRQNSFSLSYSALDYINQNRIRYRYRMEGYDDYWINAEKNHAAYYSNLPPGRYRFTVQAQDSARSLEECTASIDIRVLDNPWTSWWAILLYCLFGLGLLFLGVYQGWLKKQKGKEAEELSRLNAMQMNFFANVAHEFRTPLTMIAGPVSALAASERIAGQDRKMLGVMQRSVNWMLHLVNQILDFNRLEGDRLALKVSKQDIVPTVKEVLEVFRSNADSKGITLSDQVDGGFQLWMDADKVTKILMNLLSNALKFTPAGGQIEVSMDVLSRERAQGLFPLQEKDTDNRYVYLSVKDTGPGIPQEQLECIFERFYQLKRGQVAMGSGIGLYYSRSLATIHHGYLKAWNRTDGPSGAVFGLLLPASTYSDSEKSEEISQQKLFPVMNLEDNAAVSGSGTHRKILVVDDDVDIANYLKVILQPQYEVDTCFDVDSALQAMAQEAPDLVLSDVMMPGKSGFDLCDAIKRDIQLCHIPVILVTAMAQVSSQVEGLGKGADAYVTKPFDPAYLLALAGSLLENREKLRSQLGRVSNPSEVEDTRMAPQDKAFMKELYRLMDEELSNPELDVTLLSEKLRISRSKFYYKVKGLTGENPGEFFRRYKLNKAAGLLLEGKYNISEVADHTGFSSLSYFSSCFKKQFGVPPSEYKG